MHTRYTIAFAAEFVQRHCAAIQGPALWKCSSSVSCIKRLEDMWYSYAPVAVVLQKLCDCTQVRWRASVIGYKRYDGPGAFIALVCNLRLQHVRCLLVQQWFDCYKSGRFAGQFHISLSTHGLHGPQQYHFLVSSLHLAGQLNLSKEFHCGIFVLGSEHAASCNEKSLYILVYDWKNGLAWWRTWISWWAHAAWQIWFLNICRFANPDLNIIRWFYL